MPEKLMTIEELSVYLDIEKEKILGLVKDEVIYGYKIGGEFLRFRIDQIDAIRAEIDAWLDKNKAVPVRVAASRVKIAVGKPKKIKVGIGGDTIFDRVADFFYFNDFYIISAAIIAVLVFVILRELGFVA